MFKILLRTSFVLAVTLSVAAGVVMTSGRSDAQGATVGRGNLRPIQNPLTGGLLLPVPPAMPGFVPNPNAVRTVLTPNPAPTGTPPVDPTGIDVFTVGRIRPPMRGPTPTIQINTGGQNQQGSGGGIGGGIGGGGIGGIGGGIGGIGGGIGGIGGGIGGVGGIGGGGIGGVGQGGGGGGGTVLQPAFNLQGGVIIPANGFTGIPVIQQPTVGPPWVPGAGGGGGFGGGQIQGGFGGGIQGGIGGGGFQGGIGGGGFQGGIGGGFGGGIGGGKIGFGGLYGL